jgi:hypothetical protein
MLASSLSVMRLAKSDSIRVVYGETTVLGIRSEGLDIAVEFPLGHNLMKSLHRLVRRLAAPGRLKEEARRLNRALEAAQWREQSEERRKVRTAKSPEHAASPDLRERWPHPIGTPVTFTPPGGVPVKTQTCTEPWQLEHGSVLVGVTGHERGVFIEQLKVVMV